MGPLLLYRPLSRRYGHAVMLLAGFFCCAAGTAILGSVGLRTPYPVALAGLLLTGGASTIAFSALTSLLMSATPSLASPDWAPACRTPPVRPAPSSSYPILGSVLNTALPVTRMPAPFVILGAADIAGAWPLAAAVLRAREAA